MKRISLLEVTFEGIKFPYFSLTSSNDNDVRNESFPGTCTGVLKSSRFVADVTADRGVLAFASEHEGLRNGDADTGILSFVELFGVSVYVRVAVVIGVRAGELF